MIELDLPDLPGAVCADADPELWFTLPRWPAKRREAVAVCRTCPVRTECLQWALDHDEPEGIWGAMTAEERHKLKHPERGAA